VTRGNSYARLRSTVQIALTIWAAIVGSVSIWSFRHDAARRDFGHFLQSAQLWRDTGVLYESVARVNLNPPHVSVLLFAPLTYLPFDAAVWLWLVLQIVSLAATILIIARELNLKTERLEWIVPAIVASAMTSHNWIEGQVGGIILLVGAVAWRAARHNRETTTACALSSLISLKPQFGLMLLATRWRTGLLAALIGLGAATAAVALLGWSTWHMWLVTMRENGLQLVSWNAAFAPVLYRAGITGNPSLAILLVVCLGLICATWMATRRSTDVDRIWLLWGLTTLLVSPVGWVYYAGIFLGPLIAWGERSGWPWPAQLSLGLWMIPLTAMAWTTSSPSSLKCAILGSPYCWATVILWCAVMSTRQAHNVPSDSATVPTAGSSRKAPTTAPALFS
jgi:hypothetical protein